MLFDSVYLAVNSLWNLTRSYPIEGHVHATRCSSHTHGHVPYHYGRKINQHIRKTVSIGRWDRWEYKSMITFFSAFMG